MTELSQIEMLQRADESLARSVSRVDRLSPGPKKDEAQAVLDHLREKHKLLHELFEGDDPDDQIH